MISNCIDQLKAERRAIKHRIKQLKNERKLIKKAEKKYNRGQRRCLRDHDHDHYDRRQGRNLKKQFRHIKKQEKAAIRRGECEAPLLAWPQGVKVVYVDATSMLCAADVLRHLALSNRDRSEKALEDMAREAVRTFNLEKCVLILDNPSTFNDEEFACPLRGAGTSYDLMVQHATDRSTANSAAFITSDAVLRHRLQSLGVNVMRPKTFLRLLSQKAQERNGTNRGLEDWLECMISKQ